MIRVDSSTVLVHVNGVPELVDLPAPASSTVPVPLARPMWSAVQS